MTVLDDVVSIGIPDMDGSSVVELACCGLATGAEVLVCGAEVLVCGAEVLT